MKKVKWNFKLYQSNITQVMEKGGFDLMKEIENFSSESFLEMFGELNCKKVLDWLHEEIKKPRFRSSSIGLLMTNPRGKKERENGELAKTVQTMVEDLWLYKTYGVEKIMDVNQTRKGKLCEEDAIGLVQLVCGGDEFRIKNKRRMFGKYSSGESDMVLKNSIEDTKVAYDVNSFFRKGKDEFYTKKDGSKVWGFNKLQYGQAQDYMRLWGKDKFVLRWCAIDTPEEIIRDEEKRVFYKYGNDEEHEEYVKQSQQIRRNHDFSVIPIEERVKSFETEIDWEYLKELDERAEKAMEYYQKIVL